MELRQYLDTLRRRKWFIIGAVVLCAVVAGVIAGVRTPSYQATARILLRPDDPAEELNPTERVYRDPNRYAEAQKDIIESEAVAREAAAALGGVSAGTISKKVSVSEGSESDVLKVSAVDGSPGRARDIANALANGYIENRRKNAVVGLERAAKELQDKLGPLQAAIAELDSRIARMSAGQPPTVGPATPVPGLDPALASGTVPTSIEALKTVRSTAAVQYETLFARHQELLVDISLKRGEAELIAAAKTPGSPVSPNPPRDVAVGAFVGLLAGAGITLLRDQFDDRVHSVAEIESATGLPVLAQLPYDEETSAGTQEVAAIRRPQSSFSEATRSLRTSIQYLAIERPVKVIVVTSALPGEGKSVVAANLAAAYAHAGNRTVLVAADLRRLGVSRLFGVPDTSPGLSNLVAPLSGNGPRGPDPSGLAGPSGPAEQPGPAGRRAASGGGAGTRRASTLGIESVAGVVTLPMANLAFVPPGPTPPNPAELLGSRRMRQVLAEIAEHNDVVVVDTPPLLPVTDAAVLASQADGVVLVIAMDETRRDAVERARTILGATSARVLGVAANKAPESALGYYYGSYHSGAGTTPEGTGGGVLARRRRKRRSRRSRRR